MAALFGVFERTNKEKKEKTH